MKMSHLLTLLLLFVGTIAVADTYKWVDESGEVHYGDSPPPNVSSQRVFISEAPSAEDVERQQQQIKELLEQFEQERQLEQSSKPKVATPYQASFPEDVACFSPLSDLVYSPSAHYYTAISPNALDKKEQTSLTKWLATMKTRGTWRGALFELECWEPPLDHDELPSVKYRSFKAEMSTDWDKAESLLTLEFEVPYGHNLLYRLAVDDYFYFNEIRASNITKRDDNKVELLSHQQGSGAFLIKRYVPYRHHHHFNFHHHGTRLRADIRYIEVSDRNLKLVELYYYDGVLTGSRTWLLSRTNKT